LKITLITVCFNSEETISRTIQSVINQKYSQIEYIIIDGGSTDSTLSIIEKYKKFISIIKSENDDGIYDAINKGIILATGDLVGLLHSDDYYPNNQVITNVATSFKNDISLDIVVGDVAFIDGKENIARYYSGEKFNFNIGMMPPHPSVFLKRKCYERFGSFNTNYKIAADYDLLFRFIKINKLKYSYSKNIIVNMSLGGKSNQNIFSIIRLNLEIYKIHQSHNYSISVIDLFKKIPIRLRELLYQ